MNFNVIKENLASFIFVIFIVMSTFGYGFYWLYIENKELQNDKLSAINERHKTQLMQKDLENLMIKTELNLKNNQNLLNENSNKDLKIKSLQNKLTDLETEKNKLLKHVIEIKGAEQITNLGNYI